MRPVAIILLLIFLALAGLTGYLYFTANVVVADANCVAVDGADQAELFLGLKDQVEKGIFTGTPFETSDLGDPGEYQFLTYTIRLRNETFVKAEVAELQITPMNGDVLQMADETAHSIPARSEGSIQATILTKKDMHSVREIMITYYLWGLPFSTRITYSK